MSTAETVNSGCELDVCCELAESQRSHLIARDQLRTKIRNNCELTSPTWSRPWLIALNHTDCATGLEYMTKSLPRCCVLFVPSKISDYCCRDSSHTIEDPYLSPLLLYSAKVIATCNRYFNNDTEDKRGGGHSKDSR